MDQELAPQLMVTKLLPTILNLRARVTADIPHRVNSSIILLLLLLPIRLRLIKASLVDMTRMARSIAQLLANTLRPQARVIQGSKITEVKVDQPMGSIRRRRSISRVVMVSQEVTEALGLHLRLAGVHDLLISNEIQRTRYSQLASCDEPAMMKAFPPLFQQHRT